MAQSNAERLRATEREPRNRAVLTVPVHPNERLAWLWVGCGTEDTLFESVKQFAGQLQASGVKHTFKVTEGAHTWHAWRRYLFEVAPLLFP